MASTRHRLALLSLLAGVGLAAAVLAWPWLRAAVVEPLALVVWLLLRVFVLSVHQGVVWLALVLAALVPPFLLLRRRVHGEPIPPAFAPALRVHPVESWRWLLERAVDGDPPPPSIGWNGFVQLAVSLRALEHRVPADHHLHDALRAGRMPLPADVHAFLFPPPPTRPRGRGARLAARLRRAPRRALRRLTGRDRADRLRAVEALLSYLESSLEAKSHGHHPRT